MVRYLQARSSFLEEEGSVGQYSVPCTFLGTWSLTVQPKCATSHRNRSFVRSRRCQKSGRFHQGVNSVGGTYLPDHITYLHVPPVVPASPKRR